MGKVIKHPLTKNADNTPPDDNTLHYGMSDIQAIWLDQNRLIKPLIGSELVYVTFITVDFDDMVNFTWLTPQLRS